MCVTLPPTISYGICSKYQLATIKLLSAHLPTLHPHVIKLYSNNRYCIMQIIHCGKFLWLHLVEIRGETFAVMLFMQYLLTIA